MTKKPHTAAQPQPPRSDPAELATFDPRTKQCVMNCSLPAGDPRSAKEAQFQCDDCLPVKFAPVSQPSHHMSAVAFRQFLSDVMTAAGLVEHGRQCKALSDRLSKNCMTLFSAHEPPSQAAEPLPAGTRAQKIGGSYQATGTIVSAFKTKAGEKRYVFEFDQPAGMLHIFGPSQVQLIDATMAAKTTP